MTPRFVVAAAAVALAPHAACAAQPQLAPGLTDRYDLEHPTARYELPGRLEEVSGLAFTPDGRLFAHGDERGHVFEIDPHDGEVGKRMEVGDQTVVEDFEGIAIVEERFFLVSSRGLLYEFREVDDGGESPYRVTDLFGLARRCEVEGLEHDHVERLLLVACKTVPGAPPLPVIHQIPLDPDRARPRPITVSAAALDAWDVGAVHPSGIAVDPVSRSLVVVAARERLILEIDRDGRVRSVERLDRSRHPQTEGIAFGPDGSLYLADEAAGGDAHLTVYARRNPNLRP